MRKIKYHKHPSIENPAMLACWPGMGNVAFQAIDYIRKKINAALFAEIDLNGIIAPDAIAVDDGVSTLPKSPPILLYFSKKPPLIISIGEVQSYGQSSVYIMENLLDVAQKYKVKRIFTGAAFPMHMSHMDESKVNVVANKSSMLNWLLKNERDLEIMREGQISGLNGLMLGFAAKKDIEAACLLATLPIYAVNIPNPKASLAIIKVLQRILNINIDLTDITLSIQEIDKTLDEIERGLKVLKSEDYTKKKIPKTKVDEIPKRVLDKIEELFEEAKKDKKMAHRLKEELDRWNLFRAYEDRFLDLFRESH